MMIRGTVTSATATSRGMLAVTAEGKGRSGGPKTRHREVQVATVEVPMAYASSFPVGREVEITITARAR